jgi:hypothetical protein
MWISSLQASASARRLDGDRRSTVRAPRHYNRQVSAARVQQRARDEVPGGQGGNATSAGCGHPLTSHIQRRRFAAPTRTGTAHAQRRGCQCHAEQPALQP